MTGRTRKAIRLSRVRRSLEFVIGGLVLALGVLPTAMASYRVGRAALRLGPHVLLDHRVLGLGTMAVVFFLVFGLAGFRHASMAVRSPKLLEAFVNCRAGVRPRDWPVTADEILSAPSDSRFRMELAFAWAADTGSTDLASELLARNPSRLSLEGALFHALARGDTPAARQFLALDDATLVRRLRRLLDSELARLSRSAILLAEGVSLAGANGLDRWRRQLRFVRSSPQYVNHLWATEAMERLLEGPTKPPRTSGAAS